MRVSSQQKVIIPKSKLTDYLLSETHPVGKWKSRFFQSLGYDSRAVDALDASLREILRLGAASEAVEGKHGIKYLIDGTITGPGGLSAAIRTIWIVEKGDNVLRFVTAYPRR